MRVGGIPVHIASEADTVSNGFDPVGLLSLIRDLSGELRDMHAQTIRSIQSRFDVPDIGNWIEASSLHRDSFQDIRLEILKRVTHMVRDQSLDGLKPIGGRRRCHDVVIETFVFFVIRWLRDFVIDVGIGWLRCRRCTLWYRRRTGCR